MSPRKLAVSTLLAVFLAGAAIGYASAQVPPSIAMRIYPKRALTNARLSAVGAGIGSAWYFTVRSKIKPNGGSYGDWYDHGTYYIPAEDEFGCALRIVIVRSMPGLNYTGYFEVTQHYNASLNPVYDCDDEPVEMLVEYNDDPYTGIELSGNNHEVDDEDFVYDDT